MAAGGVVFGGGPLGGGMPAPLPGSMVLPPDFLHNIQGVFDIIFGELPAVKSRLAKIEEGPTNRRVPMLDRKGYMTLDKYSPVPSALEGWNFKLCRFLGEEAGFETYFVSIG